MNVERLTKLFNSINGTRFQHSSNSVNYQFKQLENAGYSEEVVEEVIRENKAQYIPDIINVSFVKTYIVNKEIAEKLKALEKQQAEEKAKAEQKKVQEEQSTVTLGLVEKALAKVMVEEYAPTLAEAVKDEIDSYVKETYGTIKRKIEYIFPQTNGTTKGMITHEQFETVASFVIADEPVMLVGPAGTGKNVICKQIAKSMNLEFYFSNAVTQEYKLTGFIDANGRYHETEFYKAFKNGGVFMLDEIDASIPEVLVILNAAIANRYFDFPNGKIEAHPDFRIVAAGNTFGHGASYTYVGRNQLDGASLDRFAIVNVGYSPKIEDSLTEDKDLLQFIRAFRNACENSGINHIVSYRTITRLDKMSKLLPIKDNLKSCLLKNLEQDDLRMIVRNIDCNNEWQRGLKQCADE